MKNGIRRAVIAGLAVLTIALGFLRDAVFVSINEMTGQGPGGAGALFIWKWPLTFGFAMAYLGLACLFLYLLFLKKKYIWLAVSVYALLFLASFCAGIAGYALFSFQEVYPFVRAIMGISQSPIPLMVLIAACSVNERLLVNKKA